jgi:hypothetical protein
MPYKLDEFQFHLHENARCAECGSREFHIEQVYYCKDGNVDLGGDMVYCTVCEEECELTVDPIEGQPMVTEDGYNRPLRFTYGQELAFLRAMDVAVDRLPKIFSGPKFLRFETFLDIFRPIPPIVEADLPPFDVHAMEQMVARGFPTVKRGKTEYYILLNLNIERRRRKAVEIQRVWRGHDARWKCPCFTWWKEAV